MTIGGGIGFNGANSSLLTASYFGGWTARLKNNRQSAAYLNQVDANIELDYCAQVFSSRFSWAGEAIDDLPIGYIERSIFYSGFCVAFISDIYGFLILPATASTFSVIGEPSQVIAQGYSETFTLEAGEYALLKDNNLYTNPSAIIERKSSLVADCGRTIENYLNGMKKPITLVTNDKNRITNEEIAKQLMNNSPYILAGRKKNEIEEEPPQFHNSPHNGADLMALIQAKKALINDMLGKIGVDCNGAGKNQYQSEDEIVKETFFTNLLNKQGLDNRLKFVSDVKKMFGLELVLTNNVAESQEMGDEPSDEGAVDDAD